MRARTLLLLLGAALAAVADGKKMEPVRIPAIVDLSNAKCPVSGEDADNESHVDWNGVRIRLCGADCKAAFEKDPEAAIGKLGLKVAKSEDGKAVVDLANTACPIMGKPVKPGTWSDLDGVRIHWCCATCQKKARKDPGPALRKLGYDYVPAVIDLRNTTCPISGRPAGDTVADAEGIRVHFCGPECVDGFQEDPKGTFARMAVDPAKLKETVK
jgi:YHS domain-containing protein